MERNQTKGGRESLEVSETRSKGATRPAKPANSGSNGIKHATANDNSDKKIPKFSKNLVKAAKGRLKET